MKDREALADEALALKAKAGDEEALEILLERYKPLVRKLAGKYFIRGADRDDVIQEAMIGLFKAARSYDPESGFRFAALAAISSERSIIDAVRKAETKKNSLLNDSLPLEEFALSSEEAAGVSSDLDISGKQVSDEYLVQGLLEILSAQELTIMRLRVKGLSYKDIAGQLQISTKSVDNTLQRIRAKLKDY